IAARSDSAAASARCPTSATVAGPSRKWTPSTIASTLVTAYGRARTTAASSPLPRTTRSPGGPRAATIASISENSSSGRGSCPGRWGPRRLPMAIHDARPVEVVRRQLDAHAIAGKDADAEAAHLARDVPEDRVPVVELDAEHRVRQRLHHLALELDLLFLGHGGRTVSVARARSAVVGRRRAGPAR